MANSVNAQPALLDGETVPAAELRRALPGAMFPAAGTVRGLNASALPTPDMRVRLPAGLCMVTDGQNGLYPLTLLTQTDLDIAASSATLARVDSVIAEVVDTGDGGTLVRRFRVLTGTPASSPTAPALPPGDAPTAKTLRMANVFVQPNAETNGKIRAQDVTVVAPVAGVVPRPVKCEQVTQPPFNVAMTAVDFTSGAWPPVTFTVPVSGMVFVTVSASIKNTNTDTSTIWATYRMSGGVTVATQFEDGGLSSIGASRAYASRRKLFTGLPAGATVTVTPQWQISSGSPATAQILGGQLVVEPVA